MMLPTESSVKKLAAKLATVCKLGAIIYLYGDLGAGKTTFARGFLRGLGYRGHVKSPTYTLVESYDTKKASVHHFDLYRIKDPAELEHIGIREYFSKRSICLIEWPELGAPLLPQADLACYMDFAKKGRTIRLHPLTPEGEKIINEI